MSGGRWGRFALALAIGLAAAPVSAGAQSILLENARVWTNDPAHREAASLLVERGRIVAVGTAAEPIDAPAGVERIDAGGRRVVPGFNDSHTHFFDGSFALLAPDLLSSDTPEELAHRLAAFVAGQPPGRWIVLPASWDHERWPGRTLPSRALIDSVTPSNPVWMVRPDGHIGLANSLALAAGGVTRDTPDPAGGRPCSGVGTTPSPSASPGPVAPMRRSSAS